MNRTDIIIEAVARKYGYTRDKMMELRNIRHRKIVECRHATFYIMKLHTNLDPRQIGLVYNKDRCTTIHGINQAKNLYETDREFRTTIDVLLNKISVLTHTDYTNIAQL